MTRPTAIGVGWCLAIAGSTGVRLWNALAGPRMWGYDAGGHVAYVLFLDLYRSVPWADQGWSYFHPPLHYALAWPLALAGSAELLMRGLSLLGSAASLATAALAARLVRAASPGRPGLALLAFAGLAFLPVHLYVSPMPANKLTEVLLSSSAIAVFVVGEQRGRPSHGLDALCGALLGLALLTAFSGLLALAAILAALALRAWLWPRAPRDPALRQGALIAAVAILLCSPYYARNLASFGSPFRKSSDVPAVREVEASQPPGARGWRDYLALPPRLFAEPDPLAAPLIHSVWGTAYAGTWADVYRESDAVPSPAARRWELRWRSALLLLGLAPTALALSGAGLAARDVRRGRRRELYVPLLALAAANLAAFAAYAAWVPRWPALKAYYLLGASLPWAVFLARAAEALAGRSARWQRCAAPVAVAAAALAASLLGAEGAVLPRRADSPATGAVYTYFGEHDAARRLYGRLAAGAPYPVPWLDNLAAVELADGRPARARQRSARAASLARAHGRDDAWRQSRLAVASALDGREAEALALLDAALEAEPRAELLANRGALRAARSDWAGAEADLRAALEREPALLPAWLTRARVLDRLGRPEEARAAARRARAEACRAPRHYPYGLGTGEILEWGVGRRPLLWLEGDELELADTAFYRGACARLAREASAR